MRSAWLILVILLVAGLGIVVLTTQEDPQVEGEAGSSTPAPASEVRGMRATPVSTEPEAETVIEDDRPSQGSQVTEARTASTDGRATVTLSGWTQDDPGQPLSGVTVVALLEGTNDEIGSTTSDDSGRFSIHVAPGRYDVVARQPGFVPDRLPSVEAPRDGVIFRLRAWALQRGVVVDAVTKEPIPEVLVGLRSRAEVESERLTLEVRPATWPKDQTRTKDDGTFAIEEIAPGEYVLQFRHPGYRSYEQAVAISPGQSSFIMVKLDRGLTLRGIVLDDQGGGVESALVTVHSGEVARGLMSLVQVGGLMSARTSESGRFEIGRLAQGEIRLSVTADGFLPKIDGPHLFEEQDLEVEIRLQRGITVFGTVYDGAEQPFPDASILGMQIDEQQPVTTFAEVDGHYEIGGLLPGEYVFFWGEREGDPSRFFTDPFPVTITAEPTRQAVDLRRVSAGSVTLWGTVRGPGGLLSSGSVQVLPNIRGTSPLVGAKNAEIDARGGYRLEGLAGGSAVLMVQGLADFSSGAPLSYQLVLPERGELRYDVTLPSALVTGRLVGAPIRGGTIELGLAAMKTEGPLDALLSPRAQHELDASGSFSLGPVPAGEYTLFAHVVLEDGSTRFWTAPNVRAPSRLGDIALGDDIGTLHLQIEDESSRPVGNAIVSIVSGRGEHFPRETARSSDPSGQLEIPGLPADTLTVVVSAPDRAVGRFEVRLAAGASVERRVVLQASHRLEVVVVDADDRPRAGVLVDLLDAFGAPLAQPYHMASAEEVAWRGGGGLTDEAGQVFFDALARGRYQLWVHSASGVVSQAVTVTEEDQTRVRVVVN